MESLEKIMSSMNVENAFIIKGAKNIQTYYDLLPELLRAITTKAQTLSHQSIVTLAVEQYDRLTAGVSTGYYHASQSAFTGAVDQIDDILTDASQTGGWTPFAQGFSLQVGCANRRVFGLVNSQSRELYDFFMTIPDIEEYTYSDIMGRPREFSSTKWNQRRDDWKALELGRQHLHVMDFVFIEDYGIVAPSIINDAVIPTYESRLHKLVEELTIAEVKKEFSLNSYEKLILFLTHNPEYSTRLAKNFQKLSDVLDKNLSIEKLQGVTINGIGRI